MASCLLIVLTLPAASLETDDVALKNSVDHTLCVSLLENSQDARLETIPVCAGDLRYNRIVSHPDPGSQQ
jgi:hypothetical protein